MADMQRRSHVLVLAVVVFLHVCLLCRLWKQRRKWRASTKRKAGERPMAGMQARAVLAAGQGGRRPATAEPPRLYEPSMYTHLESWETPLPPSDEEPETEELPTLPLTSRSTQLLSQTVRAGGSASNEGGEFTSLLHQGLGDDDDGGLDLRFGLCSGGAREASRTFIIDVDPSPRGLQHAGGEHTEQSILRGGASVTGGVKPSPAAQQHGSTAPSADRLASTWPANTGVAVGSLRIGDARPSMPNRTTSTQPDLRDKGAHIPPVRPGPTVENITRGVPNMRAHNDGGDDDGGGDDDADEGFREVVEAWDDDDDIPIPVSYTHLDVYKRQTSTQPDLRDKGAHIPPVRPGPTVENITRGVPNMRAHNDGGDDDGGGDDDADEGFREVVEAWDDDDDIPIRPLGKTGGRGKGRSRGAVRANGRSVGCGGRGGVSDGGGKSATYWSPEDQMLLVRCKREHEMHLVGLGHNYGRMRTKEWKWDDIVKRMANAGRPKDADDCMNKWDNLFQNYKKIQMFHNVSGQTNFFRLSNEERKEHNFKFRMERVLYNKIHAGMLGNHTIFPPNVADTGSPDGVQLPRRGAVGGESVFSEAGGYGCPEERSSARVSDNNAGSGVGGGKRKNARQQVLESIADVMDRHGELMSTTINSFSKRQCSPGW
ncbi:hypothetical protein CBR_g49786 [Chara braunii]|uniref:Myb-like domain-containing protein n=1 Tax=Chara braunii TaxID=69332 RepID=A0A388M5W8_CHABU|nr:hypothetical protein CBR_g49786 [Chara braunii]|eukprot:GBG89936.1 hypothetical protein CBR_g49786 [Chara braunii]